MIIVNAIIESDESSIAAMREAITTMVTATLEEPGCDDYCFSLELDDPTRIRITERWHTIEALAAHFQTPHMAAFQQVMAAHPPKNVTAHCYDAKEIDLPR